MKHIKTIDQYIDDLYFKLSKKDKEYLLSLDKKYGELAILFRKEFRAKNVTNTDAEFDKFIEAKRNGEKYYPKLELEKIPSSVDLKIEFESLLKKFENFPSYISKFYIEKLNGFLKSIKIQKENQQKSINHDYKKPKKVSHRGGSFPTEAEYNYALKIMQENPYEIVEKGVRNITAKEAVKMFQKKLDDLKYGYTVKLVDGMLPRVNVTPEGVVRVNPKAKFSNTDMEGLYQHELCGHVGRRYYGYQTGLNLFVIGLTENNTYDEGLAIWNSLHNVKEPKPNILFNIALKAVITYHLYDMDFCELFDFVKSLAPNMSDKTVFKSIVRLKRGVVDCHLYGGALESGYFKGYNLISVMTDEERDDVLKYNIGPDQWKELDSIKKFLEINEFKPLKIPTDKE